MRDPREQFGPVAAKYLTSEVHANETALAHYVALVKPSGGLVLDIATGAGHTAFAFAPHVERVMATDITETMLDVARTEADRRGLTNIETAAAAAEDLPYPAGTFDGVTCRTAAHHFRNPIAFAREAERVLKPGGWFLLVDTVGPDDPKVNEELNRIEFERDPSHVKDYCVDEWVAMLEGAGFSIEHKEVGPKPIAVVAWLDRMNVQEPARSRLLDAIDNSEGPLRDYLSPHGTGDDRVMHLHEMVILARKAE